MPKTIEDLLKALEGCSTKIAVKRVMHEFGWSGTKAANWVNNVWADAMPVKDEPTDGIGQRARLARRMLNAGNREKEALNAVLYLGSWLPGAYWSMTKYTRTPEDEALKAKEVERARALFEEVKATEDDDALWALLLRRGWDDYSIVSYVGKFGHSDAALKKFEESQATAAGL